MTNEEIELKMLGAMYASNVVVVGFEQRLFLAARELVSQAYEEAARVSCPYCKTSPPQPVREKWWHDDESGMSLECQAAQIHALKDSPQLKEEVASSS